MAALFMFEDKSAIPILLHGFQRLTDSKDFKKNYDKSLIKSKTLAHRIVMVGWPDSGKL